MLLVVMTTISFYTITVYTPTFGKNVLKLTDTDSLLVTFCVGLSNFIWLPVMGALSDRIGRKPMLLVFSALTLLTAYPALSWLVGDADLSRTCCWCCCGCRSCMAATTAPWWSR